MGQKFVIHVDQKEAETMLEEVKRQVAFFDPGAKHTETGIKQWGMLPGPVPVILYFYPSGRFYLTVGPNVLEVRPE